MWEENFAKEAQKRLEERVGEGFFGFFAPGDSVVTCWGRFLNCEGVDGVLPWRVYLMGWPREPHRSVRRLSSCGIIYGRNAEVKRYLGLDINKWYVDRCLTNS